MVVPLHTPGVGREDIQPFMAGHTPRSWVHLAHRCRTGRHHRTVWCVGERLPGSVPKNPMGRRDSRTSRPQECDGWYASSRINLCSSW